MITKEKLSARMTKTELSNAIAEIYNLHKETFIKILIEKFESEVATYEAEEKDSIRTTVFEEGKKALNRPVDHAMWKGFLLGVLPEYLLQGQAEEQSQN